MRNFVAKHQHQFNKSSIVPHKHEDFRSEITLKEMYDEVDEMLDTVQNTFKMSEKEDEQQPY